MIISCKTLRCDCYCILTDHLAVKTLDVKPGTKSSTQDHSLIPAQS